MNCQQLVELVTEYFEESLPPRVRARFEEHLAVCPGCTTYVEQMRQAVEKVNQHLKGEYTALHFRDS